MSTLSNLIDELRRRRVFRVAAFYGGIAFVIVQIIDGTFEVMGIPAWVSRLMIILLAIGFPVSMILTWIFDVTPDGIVRTRELTSGKSGTGKWALAIAIGVVILFAIGRDGEEMRSDSAAIQSIAVLPLDNLMGDAEQEYFVDGMHEALISNLSRLGNLKVISRTSTLRYKNTTLSMRQIAKELGVGAIVEGSVLRAGNRVRITAQLIHGLYDEHLWTNDYEADLADVLSLQKNVAEAIAEEIGLVLNPAEKAYLTKSEKVIPEAYTLYLKGWHFRTLQSAESIPNAIVHLKQAVSVDPNFAQAWAALAHSYFVAGMFTQEFDSSVTNMKDALDKAIALNPSLPEAHAGLGVYKEMVIRDYAGANESFSRAIELDPTNGYARYEFGWFLARTGYPEEAMAEFQIALNLDPLRPETLDGIAYVYRKTRQPFKALEFRQKSLDVAPGNLAANWGYNTAKIETLIERGHYEEAAVEAEKFGEWGLFWRISIEQGRRDSLIAENDLAMLDPANQEWAQSNLFSMATFYSLVGENEKALEMLEIHGVASANIDNLLYAREVDGLRAEPRFKALLKSLNLPEVFDQNGKRVN